MMQRELSRQKRHRRLRKRVAGSPARPRMAVFRSKSNLYVQLINDMQGRTLLTCSTKSKDLKPGLKSGGNVVAAESLGKFVALEAVKLGIKSVVFDRGGYRYHGRVKALAEAARKNGLAF
jgi:large subunit ribosomal protein L18